MKQDMDKVVLESRTEIDLLKNVADKAIASVQLAEKEKEVAEKLSAILDAMYISWQRGV